MMNRKLTLSLDISTMRLPQDFEEQLQLHRVSTNNTVRRPGKDEWIYVHGDDSWNKCALIVTKVGREETFYLVKASVAKEYGDIVFPALLVPFTTVDGITCLWPIREPFGKQDGGSWNVSARREAPLIMGQWAQIHKDNVLKEYVTKITGIKPPQPEIDEERLKNILELAFKDKIITEPDDSRLKAFRKRDEN